MWLSVRTRQRGDAAGARIREHLGEAESSGGRADTVGSWRDRRRRPTHPLPETRETEAERASLWAGASP